MRNIFVNARGGQLMRKPWFRQSDGWWYITIADEGGARRHERLSQDQQQAFEAWHIRQAMPAVGSPSMLAAQVIDAFLDWASHNRPAATFDWHSIYLRSFVRKWGKLPARDLRPMHVTKWLDQAQFETCTKRLSDGARRGAITSLKRAFSWAVHEGYLQSNPVGSVKRPKAGRREQLVEDDQNAKISTSTDGAFRAFLIALRLTGCRPKEIRTVEASNVNLPAEVWERVQNKTGNKTGLSRTVYISNPCMMALTRILLYFRPSGPLFLNSRGKLWTANAISCRMRQLRAKHGLPSGMVAYSFRHTFITESLTAGVDAATVAELCGTSVEMIHRHYGHLTQKGDHLRRAARSIGNRPRT